MDGYLYFYSDLSELNPIVCCLLYHYRLEADLSQESEAKDESSLR